MRDEARRGARLLVVPLAVSALALTGCTSSGSAPQTRPTATAPAPAPPAPKADAAAQRVLRHAIVATEHVSSYRFAARTVVRSRQALRTTLTGRVIRGTGLAYRLTVGRNRTLVVRVRRGTYVRRPPGRWSRLHHPGPRLNPTSTLLAVLRGLTPTGVSRAGRGQVVRGVLTSRAAAKAGLSHDRGLTRVGIRLDRRYHVVGLVILAHTAAGSRHVLVFVRSVYRGFGRVARIRPPA